MSLLTLINGCASPPAPPDAGCLVFGPIYPEPGFRQRWTDGEQAQVDAHDRVWAKTCERKG